MDSKKQDTIYSMLKILFPKECRRAGELNVRNIAAGYTNQITAQGGANIDTSIVIDLLSLAVAIGGLAYDYIKDKTGKKEKPQYHEVKNIISSNVTTNINIEKMENVTINIYQFVQQNINIEPKDGDQKA